MHPRPPFSKSIRLLWLAALICLGGPAPARAQREAAWQAAPAVFLDTDPVAAKMLGAARDFLAARQWADAVDLLRQITAGHGERLVAIEPGRYVNVQTFADILIASMPPEGLQHYRTKTDPQARRWFEAARRLRDEEGLEKTVRKAFLSSYGDDALLLLGELAWEQGAVARARNYWEKLLPPTNPPAPGDLPRLLNFPDSRIDPALIRARIIVCSLIQGNAARAKRELESFRESHPLASGNLAGRQGNLVEILEGLVADAANFRAAPAAELEISTFAGDPGRNQVFPRAVDVGGVSWSAPLTEMRLERSPRADDVSDRFERTATVLSYFPVVWKDVVFYCDDDEVLACELKSDKGGRPPWGNEPSIYKLPADLQQPLQPQRPRAGLPRFTLTVHRGKLYARLGATAAPSGKNRNFRPPESVLVRLDLARQGDLDWMIKAGDLESEGGKWIFDGAPVAEGDRVYVALRRSDPQLQLNVACFDANSARMLWNRKVCRGVESLAGDADDVRHQLLTLAEERLYYCTNLGAVAALDARDGAMRWVSTYPRIESETIAAFNNRQLHGPNPCLFHDGLLLAAPTDADRVLAYDAETGILKWEQELGGPAPQLLGVAGGRLIAAGNMLWALDTETGRVAWRDGRIDPEAATFGRGLLAGGLVYWPRREEIRIVDIATGEVRRQIDLVQHYGLPGGGNLTIAGDMLLVAQSDRLVAFSPFGMLKKPARKELVLRHNPPPPIPY